MLRPGPTPGRRLALHNRPELWATSQPHTVVHTRAPRPGRPAAITRPSASAGDQTVVADRRGETTPDPVLAIYAERHENRSETGGTGCDLDVCGRNCSGYRLPATGEGGRVRRRRRSACERRWVHRSGALGQLGPSGGRDDGPTPRRATAVLHTVRRAVLDAARPALLTEPAWGAPRRTNAPSTARRISRSRRLRGLPACRSGRGPRSSAPGWWGSARPRTSPPVRRRARRPSAKCRRR